MRNAPLVEFITQLLINVPDRLQAADELAGGRGSQLPLARLFHVGQYVRCSILSLDEGAPGLARNGQGPMAADVCIWQRLPLASLHLLAGAQARAHPAAGSKEQRRRIHLSLRLSRLANGLTPSAFAAGAGLPGCVTSVEDHGYLLLFGVQVRPGLPSADGVLGPMVACKAELPAPVPNIAQGPADRQWRRVSPASCPSRRRQQTALSSMSWWSGRRWTWSSPRQTTSGWCTPRRCRMRWQAPSAPTGPTPA